MEIHHQQTQPMTSKHQTMAPLQSLFAKNNRKLYNSRTQLSELDLYDDNIVEIGSGTPRNNKNENSSSNFNENMSTNSPNKMLSRFNPNPKKHIQSKIEYLILPYNQKLQSYKHMKFEEDKEIEEQEFQKNNEQPGSKERYVYWSASIGWHKIHDVVLNQEKFMFDSMINHVKKAKDLSLIRKEQKLQSQKKPKHDKMKPRNSKRIILIKGMKNGQSNGSASRLMLATSRDKLQPFVKNSDQKPLDVDSEKSDRVRLKVVKKFDPRLARRSVEETIKDDKKIHVQRSKFQKPQGRVTQEDVLNPDSDNTKNASQDFRLDSAKFSISKFSEELPGIFVEKLEHNGNDTIYQSIREDDMTADGKQDKNTIIIFQEQIMEMSPKSKKISEKMTPKRLSTKLRGEIHDYRQKNFRNLIKSFESRDFEEYNLKIQTGRKSKFLNQGTYQPSHRKKEFFKSQRNSILNQSILAPIVKLKQEKRDEEIRQSVDSSLNYLQSTIGSSTLQDLKKSEIFEKNQQQSFWRRINSLKTSPKNDRLNSNRDSMKPFNITTANTILNFKNDRNRANLMTSSKEGTMMPLITTPLSIFSPPTTSQRQNETERKYTTLSAMTFSKRTHNPSTNLNQQQSKAVKINTDFMLISDNKSLMNSAFKSKASNSFKENECDTYINKRRRSIDQFVGDLNKQEQSKIQNMLLDNNFKENDFGNYINLKGHLRRKKMIQNQINNSHV
ncbi:UNKNOWN [Stylonychia lemnae]|uniref:Uncharacterized protein n=1 Tax=Stylonychia lemnae TaxID=5949 RepID=A0A078AK56_STYLE|nr:UNKNOWN [Stylonychia lemnae]|eukprot:CDW82765.1 UNKNOWN [Stylonychia lemnae]